MFKLTVKVILLVLAFCEYRKNGQGGRVSQVAGTTGRVVGIDSDGDLKVATNDGNTWVLNPQCCIKQQNGLAIVRRTTAAADDDGSDVAAGKTSCIKQVSLGNFSVKKWMTQSFKH